VERSLVDTRRAAASGSTTLRMTTRIGIAAGLPDVRQYMAWARSAESAGFRLLGHGDTQCLLPELHVSLAAMATATDRVLLCPTVTNPLTRHPAVAAAAFGTLQQLSGGRARFGIGTGDSAVTLLGERPARVDHVADYCRAFRALTTGNEADYRGRSFRLEWPAPEVPLWIAAEGPRMLKLAGELGDGVIMGNGLTEDVVRDNLRRVREAAVEAGRDPDAIEPWFFAKIYLCESEEQAWHDVAWTLAATANHAFQFTLDDKLVPPEHHAAIGRLRNGYASRAHNGLAHSPAANAALVIENGLTEYLGRRFLLAGPPARVLERIEELAAWGARNLLTSAIFGDPFEYTAQIAEHIVRPLRRGGG
jgi:5,10-methylenetetrahydromethanopterin reductase